MPEVGICYAQALPEDGAVGQTKETQGLNLCLLKPQQIINCGNREIVVAEHQQILTAASCLMHVCIKVILGQ